MRCRKYCVITAGILAASLLPNLASLIEEGTREGRPGTLAVSGNGHYLTKDGLPFFWLGDTTWSLVNRYTRDEAEIYLEHRRRQGFTVEHIMFLFDGGPGLTTLASNTDGVEPLRNTDLATPNEEYFKGIDRLIEMAHQKGLVIVVMPCGGSAGSFIKKKRIVTKEKARAYGKWLGQRYRNMPNIIWANGFDLKPWEFEDVSREFSAGLREGDGGSHLITFHPAGGSTSSYFHYEKWLDLNLIQTWSDYWRICPMVSADYLRVPPKPVVMAEGAYEAGPEYPSAPITALLVRKQAYWSYLAGGFHTYGHTDMWRKNPTWREALDSPGARQMSILKKIFTEREWWRYVPDQSVFAMGASGEKTQNAAARSTGGDSIIVYLASSTTVSIHLSNITSSKTVLAKWVNPENGDERDAGRFPNAGQQAFTTPEPWSDAVLLLQSDNSRLLQGK